MPANLTTTARPFKKPASLPKQAVECIRKIREMSDTEIAAFDVWAASVELDKLHICARVRAIATHLRIE